MKTKLLHLRKIEFEARMFISLSIIFLMCMLSYPVFKGDLNNFQLFNRWLLIFDEARARTIGFLFVAFLLLIATLVRMWAGSTLNSGRIMAFKVQKDLLVTSGAFSLIRNPIYMADLIAYVAFALCLKPIALSLPFLIYLHYIQLVKFEESFLSQQFEDEFRRYKINTPNRFFPTRKGIRNIVKSLQTFQINYDGFRNNAQYLLFIPGFIIAAYSGNFVLALIIGLPAVIDWAIIHIQKGIKKKEVKDLTKGTLPGNKKESQSKVFDGVLYAQCWEDPMVDLKAFQIDANDIIFSITSGGCNVLTFLIENPRKIIALDLNPHQNYLLDLKMAAFKQLTYEQMLEFLGVIYSFRRVDLYQKIRFRLQPDSQHFWDKHLKEIKEGIIHCGRYERYMHLLKKWFTWLMGKDLIQELFKTQNQEAQKKLYSTRWDNYRWRIFTRLFLSRSVMSILFTKTFFSYLESSFSFGKHFRKVIKRCVTELPIQENYFLAYILLDKYFSLDHLPLYLQKKHFETIRSRLDRIDIKTSSCENYFEGLPDSVISKFNFSNIFEWMPQSAFESLLEETIRIAKNEAVLTYRNLLVPRSRPAKLGKWIYPDRLLAKNLHQQDRSFIYNDLIIERIAKLSTQRQSYSQNIELPQKDI